MKKEHEKIIEKMYNDIKQIPGYISGCGGGSACLESYISAAKDYEIYDFVLKNYYQLRFSPAVATDVKETGRNPKRVQRDVRKQIQNIGIGTKSQQALKLQQEQLKTERKTVSREQREAKLCLRKVIIQKGGNCFGKIKYQVFISSTYSDLYKERKQVLDILLMADCIPGVWKILLRQMMNELNK